MSDTPDVEAYKAISEDDRLQAARFLSLLSEQELDMVIVNAEELIASAHDQIRRLHSKPSQRLVHQGPTPWIGKSRII